MQDERVRVYRGCILPLDLLYDVEHDVWVRLEGEQARLGMTDPAQTRAGKLVAIRFKRPGTVVERGRALATIESGKWVGPFPAPFRCEILETNQSGFERDILLANRDPYGEGWLLLVRPLAPEQLDDLLPGEEAFQRYRQRIDELGLTCFRCAE
ncbi:glycine cleavage system protein H [Thermomicrobium sp. CFH 73360]|uniref:glycine cleavage system protein H n=1 Tax=Thermomicrobium sp. CFH 73360 TaxID=2951987 RepID=UPI002076F40B|nr:glycine cleavage system protein H [Thermomicrobium sp. CFH 73360]MCM8745820.1 glycine cleavage system protein H [Thermomicrobium sp. CFH 73360]